MCVFSSCSFCPNDTVGSLHRAFSDGIGEILIEIKLKTQNDHVRTYVSKLEGAGDASALEKYYHRTCLRSAERTFTPVFHSNVQEIRTVCDEQLLLSSQNTLSDGVTLNMGEVNDAYLLILKIYHVEFDETTNYRKHLKQLNTDHLSNTQVVKSFRKNEPDNIILPKTVSKAMKIRSTLLNNGEIIGQLKNMADILREEIMQHRNWSFNGSFEDYDNPHYSSFPHSSPLRPSIVMTIYGMRNDELVKTVDVACQFLVQNTRSDRQVNHQPKKNDLFQHTVQTPLSIGLPLAVHCRVRDKNLVNILSKVYIGSHYRRIFDLEKRVEQPVLQRIKETGGFCLPDFFKKGKPFGSLLITSTS